MEKIYRIIYMNTRSKIGPIAMMKFFPLAEKHIYEWKFYEHALRGKPIFFITQLIDF